MSHPVSAYFNVPHGVANAILLPTVVEYNALADNGKYFKLYSYISEAPVKKEEFKPQMLAELLKELNKSLEIPASLSEAGVTKDKFEAMADDAMKSGNIMVNPRSTTKEDVLMLYGKAF
jgi:alcohol dehydrogenase